MVSPNDFVARWGKNDRLMRFRADSLKSLVLAEEDKEFLVEAGLPESAAPFLNFEAPKAGELPTVADHFDQTDELCRYRVIGFDGSGSPIAIDEERSGEVVCLDHEEKFARTFMNTTIRQLAESLLAYRDAVPSPAAAENEESKISLTVRKQVLQKIRKVDPAALQSGCFWSDQLKIADVKEDYPAQVLRDLVGPDAKLRLAASRHLQSELRKGETKQRKELFGNQKATTPLIAALEDPAPEVVRNAMIALAMISVCYFQDDRAYGKVIQLLRCKDVMTQSWAICAAIRLRGQESLDDVLRRCKDRSPIVRNRVLYELFRWLMETRPNGVSSLRPENEKRLQNAALDALNAEPEMRGGAAFLLCELGNEAALAAVRARLKKERNRDTKQSIEQALEMVEER